YLPAQYALLGKVRGNAIGQLLRPEILQEAEISRWLHGRLTGTVLLRANGESTVVVARSGQLPESVSEALFLPDGRVPQSSADFLALAKSARWLKPLTRKVGATHVEECSER